MTKIAEPVPAIPCREVYADYDGNAPDTSGVILVADSELATEIAAELNKRPRAYTQAVVDGWEHAKRWDHREVFVAPARAGEIHTVMTTAMVVMRRENEG